MTDPQQNGPSVPAAVPTPAPYTSADGAAAKQFADLNPYTKEWLSRMSKHDVIRLERHLKRMDDAETILGFIVLLIKLGFASFIASIAVLQGATWYKNHIAK